MSKNGYVSRGMDAHSISRAQEDKLIPVGSTCRGVSPRLYNPSQSDYLHAYASLNDDSQIETGRASIGQPSLQMAILDHEKPMNKTTTDNQPAFPRIRENSQKRTQSVV